VEVAPSGIGRALGVHARIESLRRGVVIAAVANARLERRDWTRALFEGHGGVLDRARLQRKRWDRRVARSVAVFDEADALIETEDQAAPREQRKDGDNQGPPGE
jgi:hypothetical protein